jgi:hypothetical protein
MFCITDAIKFCPISSSHPSSSQCSLLSSPSILPSVLTTCIIFVLSSPLLFASLILFAFVASLWPCALWSLTFAVLVFFFQVPVNTVMYSSTSSVLRSSRWLSFLVQRLAVPLTHLLHLGLFQMRTAQPTGLESTVLLLLAAKAFLIFGVCNR